MAIATRVQQITAEDGHTFSAFEALPEGRPRATLLLMQEILGVNGHIRFIADGFAREGFRVVAPALFDRLERNVSLNYTPADIGVGRALMDRVDKERVQTDIAATYAFVAGDGAAGIIGYCWGATMGWRAAARLDGLKAAVCYYPGGIGGYVQEHPLCPTICHFGDRDRGISLQEVDLVRPVPNVTTFVYPAAHGFNCNDRDSFDPAVAAVARERTLDHLQAYLK